MKGIVRPVLACIVAVQETKRTRRPHAPALPAPYSCALADTTKSPIVSLAPTTCIQSAAEPAGAAADPVAEQDIRIDLPDGDSAQARIYGLKSAVPGAALVLHFHGGSFVSGGLDNGRTVARLLARAGARVLSLAYPLAPEFPFPRPIEVGAAALQWLHTQRARLAGKGARVFVAGEEAGGNLAAAVALVSRDRGHPPLAGQLLLSPMLDPCAGTASLRQATHANADACPWASGWQQFLGRCGDAMHPYAVPGTSLRLAGLAPLLLLLGENDPMRDEAQTFAQRLRAAGVPVRLQVLAGAANWPAALHDPEGAACMACAQEAQACFRAFLTAEPVDGQGCPA